MRDLHGQLGNSLRTWEESTCFASGEEREDLMNLPKLDPRYLILTFLVSFMVAGQLFLGFFQKWDAFSASVLTATLTELVLSRWVFKEWRFPLSALISGIGIGLLLSSHLVWPYALAAFLAIVCKFVIRIGGSHVFNPNNIAIVTLLYFLPQYAVSTPKQWTNGFGIMLFILVLGMAAAYAARRLDTVLAFIAGYLLFASIRHWGFGEPFYYSFGPMLGASFQLFTFFMITDPKTTPPTRKIRIIAALLIAFVDSALRLNAITNSLFYASFWVMLCYGLPYRLYRTKQQARGL